MKALTIWPEWVWAIVYLDKRVENRSWPLPTWMRGEELAIHAGGVVGGRLLEPWEAIDSVTQMANRENWSTSDTRSGAFFSKDDSGLFYLNVRTLTCGAVAAVATVEDVVRATVASALPWAVPGQFQFVLGDVKPIEPVSCRGFQKLWNLPEDIEATVRERLKCQG
jgi:hypothetical protein